MRELPKEEKELRGTYEPSKEGIEPIEYDSYERVPQPPEGWPPEAQTIFRDRCYDLKQAGYLMKVMMAPLRRYCFAIYQAQEAERHLLDEGFVTVEIGTKGQEYEVPSKWLMVLDNANKTIEKLGAKFGFSPLDVQKIPAVKKKEATEMSLLK